MNTSIGIWMTCLAASFAASTSAHAAPRTHALFLTKPLQLERSRATFGLPAARKQLVYFGGPVIATPQAYAVMWGEGVDQDVRTRIGGMISATLNSDYLDLLSQYSTTIPAFGGGAGTNQRITRGSYGGTLTIQPGDARKELEDADIGAEIERQIEAGTLPKPDANTLLFLYFPPGYSLSVAGAKSCEVFCGYHSSVKTRNHGQVYYAVQPDLGGACAMGCGFASTPFDNMTVITAHELAEAVTDPAVDPNAELGPPIAWVTQQGEEIGDICATETTSVTTPDGTRYRLQSAFDNRIFACGRGPYRSR